jgi:hypothetical protein
MTVIDIAKKEQYTCIADKYKMYLRSLQNKPEAKLFLFLKPVCINYIFSDNARTYILFIYNVFE